MFEPVRGGTRGGQAEFKWSDVSADKDRENYLGHSINAPTGRWQKNKDVHWYNRDIKDEAAERAEEIKRIKEAEAEALSAALGFGPSTKTTAAGTTTANSLKPDAGDATQINSEKEEKKRRKAERKEEKRARKEARRAERLQRDSGHARHRTRSQSPHRDGSRKERGYHTRSSRSRSPPRLDRRYRSQPSSDYDELERQRERERDRRRWDLNSGRENPRTARGHD